MSKKNSRPDYLVKAMKRASRKLFAGMPRSKYHAMKQKYPRKLEARKQEERDWGYFYEELEDW